MRKGLWLAGLVLAVMALALPAQATPLLDFGTGSSPTGGLVVYNLPTGVTGTGIPIGTLSINGTGTAYDGTVQAVTAGTTGTYGSLNFNTVANTFSITGAIPSLGINTAIVLVNGLGFSSWFGTETGSCGFASGPCFTATGSDTKATALLAALSLGGPNQWVLSGFTLTGVPVLDGRGVPIPHEYSANSTDFQDKPVPEPGSMLLLGSGLIGLAGAVRRRLKK